MFTYIVKQIVDEHYYLMKYIYMFLAYDFRSLFFGIYLCDYHVLLVRDSVWIN